MSSSTGVPVAVPAVAPQRHSSRCCRARVWAVPTAIVLFFSAAAMVMLALPVETPEKPKFTLTGVHAVLITADVTEPAFFIEAHLKPIALSTFTSYAFHDFDVWLVYGSKVVSSSLSFERDAAMQQFTAYLDWDEWSSQTTTTFVQDLKGNSISFQIGGRSGVFWSLRYRLLPRGKYTLSFHCNVTLTAQSSTKFLPVKNTTPYV